MPALFLPHVLTLADGEETTQRVVLNNATLDVVATCRPSIFQDGKSRWFGQAVKSGKKVAQALRQATLDHVLEVLQRLLEVDATAVVAHGEAFFIVAALIRLPLRTEAYRLRRLSEERCEQLELQVQKLRAIVALAPQGVPLTTFYVRWREAFPELAVIMTSPIAWYVVLPLADDVARYEGTQLAQSLTRAYVVEAAFAVPSARQPPGVVTINNDLVSREEVPDLEAIPPSIEVGPATLEGWAGTAGISIALRQFGFHVVILE
ncbi:MAG: hypothetical protein VX837_00880, partial [Candidatus Thermoplasmatota archaeon]|nr:hypothetical protein [Candidatus Thermoplasmatota archaeon]